ncbi:MAG: hypothetical protein FWD73_12035 [Polyangiaceae bacterium]|nr:hypothetical protein [Polyangiaceae bacterium]
MRAPELGSGSMPNDVCERSRLLRLDMLERAVPAGNAEPGPKQQSLADEARVRRTSEPSRLGVEFAFHQKKRRRAELDGGSSL